MNTKQIKTDTKLEKAVLRLLKSKVEKGYSLISIMREVTQHGCESGIIGELIYYSDTCKFYKKHKDDINSLLKEALLSSGYKYLGQIFGDKWDDEDPLAEDTQNQNLLAWFAFEETTRALMDRAEIE